MNADDKDILQVRAAIATKLRDTGKAELTSTEVCRLFSKKSAEQRDNICLLAKLRPEVRHPAGGGKTVFWIA